MTEASEAAQHMLADLMQQIDPGSMVTGFVCLAEIVDSDGDQAVWSFVPPAAKAWQTVGLLSYGLMLEQNGLDAQDTA